MHESSSPSHDYLTLADIVGVYGIKGWVRVRSFTDPPANILDYHPWQLRQQQRLPQTTLGSHGDPT